MLRNYADLALLVYQPHRYVCTCVQYVSFVHIHHLIANDEYVKTRMSYRCSIRSYPEGGAAA